VLDYFSDSDKNLVLVGNNIIYAIMINYRDDRILKRIRIKNHDRFVCVYDCCTRNAAERTRSTVFLRRRRRSLQFSNRQIKPVYGDNHKITE